MSATPADAAPAWDPNRTNANLAGRYIQALDGFDLTLLDRRDAVKGDQIARLSGLFLPSMPPQLQRARQRIMVVGAETAGWNVLKFGEPLTTLDAYIAQAMDKHQTFFQRQLGLRRARGKTFFNFMREVAATCGSDGLIYANLFCCDWQRGTPMRSARHYAMVQHYSSLLLRAQVEFFDPHIIIFANGSASAAARRTCFPTAGPDTACTDGKDYWPTHQVPNSQLWEFSLHKTIRCFRIQHPSSRSPNAPAARRHLLSLLANSQDAPARTVVV